MCLQAGCLPGTFGHADVSAALSEHAALIAAEVLAVEYGPDVAVEGVPEHADADLGLRFWLRIA